MGMHSEHAGPLVKPSRLDRDDAKFARQQDRARERRRRERAEQAAWEVIRAGVYQRDQGRSRASGTPLKLHSQNPREVADCNHLIFRSAGGSSDPSNLCTLTREEHDMVHARHPRYVLDISGDANSTLTFVRRDVETGKVLELWESPCPAPGDRQ